MAKVKSRSYSGVLPDEPGEAGGSFYDGPTPPAGAYKGKVKRLGIKENKNGDDMLNAVIEIDEPKKSPKAKFNGYGIWHNANITEQGAPYLAQWLDAMGFSYKEFAANVVVDEDGMVVKIGKRRISGDETVTVVTKVRQYNGEDQLSVTRFVVDQIGQADDDEDEDLDDDADSEDDDEDDDSEEDEEDEEDDDEDDDDDDDEDAYSRAELEAMPIADLRAILKDQYEWTPADWKGMSKADIVNELLDEGDDDEDDEGDAPPF